MNRYYCFYPGYIESDILKGSYAFASEIANEEGSHLTICVNNIRTNQCIESIFGRDSVSANKLNRREPIDEGGTEVILKSPRGLDSYQDYGVVLAIHPSQELMEKIENNTNNKSIVVIAEVPPDGRCDYLNTWASDKKAQELNVEKSA